MFVHQASDTSLVKSGIEISELFTGPDVLYCFLGQGTLLSQRLSIPRRYAREHAALQRLARKKNSTTSKIVTSLNKGNLTRDDV